MVGPCPRRLCCLRRRGWGGRGGTESVCSAASSPGANMGLLPRPCEILLEEGIWESTTPETVLFPSSHNPFAPEDTTT